MSFNSVFSPPLQKTCKRFASTNFALAAAYPTLAEMPVAIPTSNTYPVIDLDTDGTGKIANWVNIWPYGNGANNDVITIFAYGWVEVLSDANAHISEWLPVPLAEFTCTLSTFTGPSAAAAGYTLLLTNTDRFADTITLASTGVANVDNVIKSNAANVPAAIALATTGYRYIGLLMKAAAATAANALYQLTV